MSEFYSRMLEMQKFLFSIREKNQEKMSSVFKVIVINNFNLPKKVISTVLKTELMFHCYRFKVILINF